MVEALFGHPVLAKSFNLIPIRKKVRNFFSLYGFFLQRLYGFFLQRLYGFFLQRLYGFFLQRSYGFLRKSFGNTFLGSAPGLQRISVHTSVWMPITGSETPMLTGRLKMGKDFEETLKFLKNCQNFFKTFP